MMYLFMNVFNEKGITHLDLHGVRHLDAFDEVIDFVYQYQSELPLIIICGNSNRMIEIVENSLKFKFYYVLKAKIWYY